MTGEGQIEYITSFEDLSYWLTIIALLLAIVQFGLAYSGSPPVWISRIFRAKTDTEASNMLNKTSGIISRFFISILIGLVFVFLWRLANTFALYVGFIVFKNNHSLAFITSYIVILVLAFGFFWFVIWKPVKAPSKLPFTDTQILSGEVRELIKSLHTLADRIEVQNKNSEQTNRKLDDLIRKMSGGNSGHSSNPKGKYGKH